MLERFFRLQADVWSKSLGLQPEISARRTAFLQSVGMDPARNTSFVDLQAH
jgi:hypothetical protein